jgi:hypothetical protein
MPVTLVDLPAELLVHVAQCLRGYDLKQLRLVCRHVLGPATSELYYALTIRLHSSHGSLEHRFSRILNEPGLSQCVRELYLYAEDSDIAYRELMVSVIVHHHVACTALIIIFRSEILTDCVPLSRSAGLPKSFRNCIR